MTKLEIDVRGISQTDGARNSLYLVPTQERDMGDVPLVCVVAMIGAGTPSPAYHHQWRYLGKVSTQAVPESVEDAVRGAEETILEIASLYEGKHWDGNNHVGSWRQDDKIEDAGYQLQEALSQVSTYWAASDYFAPLGGVDLRMRELATDANLGVVVERELKNADTDVHLNEVDVQECLLDDAQTWLDNHTDPSADTEDERTLRARLEGWLK